MSRLRVAALQMVSGARVADNLAVAERLLAGAAEQGCALAVMPEAFAVFGDPAAARACAIAEAEGEAPLQTFLMEQARRHRMIVVGGTVPIAVADGRARAAVLVYGADGQCLGRYDKIHLFDAVVGDATGSYRESGEYQPGDTAVVLDTPVGRLGLAVCYDVRFPELFRLMQARGMDMLAVPAAFTRRTGLAHWLPLLRARAIENQCIVIGANQGGCHSATRETSGGSVVVDGWGTVLAEAGFGEACVVAEIDLEATHRLRAQMPVSSHRRMDLTAPD